MSNKQNNKAIVGRWFTEFWGKTCNLGIVDELAAPDMLLQYSLHAPRKGHAEISGVPPILLPRATMLSAVGKAVVRTPVRRSVIFS